MSNHNNYTTIQTVCPDCENNHILKDNIRQETYCTHCGLILEDQTIPSITSLIKISQKKEEEWEEKKKNKLSVWEGIV